LETFQSAPRPSLTGRRWSPWESSAD
jgi:hypothetical protein